jgi:hypothetical protein
MPAPADTFFCPYIHCKMPIARSNFADHVLNYHTRNKDQVYLCPLCVGPEMVIKQYFWVLMFSKPVYHVNKKTNLSQHIQMAHLLSPPSAPEVPVPPKKEIKVNLIGMCVLILREFIGIEEVLTKDLQEECSICYEDLHANQKIARLECLCVYHA